MSRQEAVRPTEEKACSHLTPPGKAPPPLNLTVEFRKLAYHLSMAIERLLLDRKGDVAMKALERLELIRTQLDELPPL